MFRNNLLKSVVYHHHQKTNQGIFRRNSVYPVQLQRFVEFNSGSLGWPKLLLNMNVDKNNQLQHCIWTANVKWKYVFMLIFIFTYFKLVRVYTNQIKLKATGPQSYCNVDFVLPLTLSVHIVELIYCKITLCRVYPTSSPGHPLPRKHDKAL